MTQLALDMDDRKRFLGLSPRSSRHLFVLQERLPELCQRLVERFEERLAKVPSLRARMEETTNAEARAARVREHLVDLVNIAFSDDLVARRRWLGEAYEAMGFPPEFHVLAYQSYFEVVLEALVETEDLSPDLLLKALLTLTKAVQLDTTVVIQAQFDAQDRRIRDELAASQNRETQVRATLVELAGSLAASAEEARTQTQRIEATASELERRVGGVTDAGTTATREAAEGAELVNEAVTALRATQPGMAGAQEALARMSEGAEEVAATLAMIREISAQTNLLSINASLEAARAGEAGRGFSVVAGEVGRLSAQTRAALDTIELRVRASHEQMRELTEAMETARAQVEHLGNRTEAVAERFGSIHGAVQSGFEELDWMAKSTTDTALAARLGEEAGAEVADLASRLAALAERLLPDGSL